MSTYDAKTSAWVERFAATLTEAGMQRTGSRVFACLIASEEGALTSAELGERLQVSPAAVSGAVRYLAALRMLSRQREPGTRRERYHVDEQTWFETLTNRDQVLQQWTETMRAGAATLGPDTAAGRRIAHTGEFFEFLRLELTGILAKWRAQQED